MKKTAYLLFSILVCCRLLSMAQASHGNTWLLGYRADPSAPSPDYGGTLLDFTSGGVEKYRFDIPFSFTANASISDHQGRLLFYTNGCQVIRADHKEMKEGDGINQGDSYYEQNCLGIVGGASIYAAGYPTKQGILILPWPGRPQQYALFHLHWPEIGARVASLRMSTVDMQQDSLRGAVVESNRDDGARQPGGHAHGGAPRQRPRLVADGAGL